MGLFSSSSNSEFKNKTIETLNFLSNYSFGQIRMSEPLAKLKAETLFQEMTEIANRYSDPYNEYITIYIDSVFGEKITVAEALIFMNHVKSHAMLAGERITKSFTEQTLNWAKRETNTISGREKLFKILKSI